LSELLLQLDPQRHRLSGPRAHSCDCNTAAILNLLRRCDLGAQAVPNCEEFLCGEEKDEKAADRFESGVL